MTRTRRGSRVYKRVAIDDDDDDDEPAVASGFKRVAIDDDDEDEASADDLIEQQLVLDDDDNDDDDAAPIIEDVTAAPLASSCGFVSEQAEASLQFSRFARALLRHVRDGAGETGTSSARFGDELDGVLRSRGARAEPVQGARRAAE